MPLRVQRRGLLPALVVAVLGTVLLYLAATKGVAALSASRAQPEPGVGALPTIVVNAPASVPTTGESGPVGAVSMVFAGTEVRDGLFGEVEHPWLAISSHGGEYRAIEGPGLPGPGSGVMSASPDGNLLAWAGEGAVVVHDAVSGESEEVDLAGVDGVGSFSPDGSMVLVHGAEGLAVLDTTSGETLATTPADAGTVTRAAWRPDGSALDFVRGDRLVTLGVPGGEESSRATTIPEAAALAWSPAGDRLADLREIQGVHRLFVSPVGPDGELRAPQQVDTEGIALQRLLGFSGEQTIAVVARRLESGSIELVLDIRLDGRSASDLTTLPPPGDNWADTATLSIATDNLVAGSTDFGEQRWSWSYLSRLVGCVVLSFFLFGLYVTRRPRDRRR